LLESCPLLSILVCSMPERQVIILRSCKKLSSRAAPFTSKMLFQTEKSPGKPGPSQGETECRREHLAIFAGFSNRRPKRGLSK
jgi:hypothetical protein